MTDLPDDAGAVISAAREAAWPQDLSPTRDEPRGFLPWRSAVAGALHAAARQMQEANRRSIPSLNEWAEAAQWLDDLADECETWRPPAGA